MDEATTRPQEQTAPATRGDPDKPPQTPAERSARRTAAYRARDARLAAAADVSTGGRL